MTQPNPKTLSYLLQSIEIRGGHITKNEAGHNNNFSLFLPVPGTKNAQVAIHQKFGEKLKPEDVVGALYEAQTVLDAIQLPAVLEE